MGGDNWNLDGVVIHGRDETGDHHLFATEGGPLFRFTGDQRTREFIF